VSDESNPSPEKAAAVKPRFSATLMDHARNPRNMDEIPEYNGFAINDGYCGDMMMMWIRVNEGIIKTAVFNTDGCGPSIACGSMATEMALGKSIEQIRDITPEKIIEALEGLPADHEHCASLAAGTLQLALTDYLQCSL
jgi:nitrogen fixation NifU-like protein